jgi:hypothetical protein
LVEAGAHKTTLRGLQDLGAAVDLTLGIRAAHGGGSQEGSVLVTFALR